LEKKGEVSEGSEQHAGKCRPNIRGVNRGSAVTRKMTRRSPTKSGANGGPVGKNGGGRLHTRGQGSRGEGKADKGVGGTNRTGGRSPGSMAIVGREKAD